jgi:hypothetical protein
MSEPHLDTSHLMCRSLDYRESLEALLEEFRHGTWTPAQSSRAS